MKGTNLLFLGHSSAPLSAIATYLELDPVIREIDENFQPDKLPWEGIDICAMVVNARTGISREMIEVWMSIVERQYPRFFIVTGLLLSENDFDDIVLIINRTCEPVITPVLILHDEAGMPAGLIHLDDLMVEDFSAPSKTVRAADDELTSLVEAFRTEYFESLEGSDGSEFLAGILVPAFPLEMSNGLGRELILRYIKIMTTR